MYIYGFILCASCHFEDALSDFSSTPTFTNWSKALLNLFSTQHFPVWIAPLQLCLLYCGI